MAAAPPAGAAPARPATTPPTPSAPPVGAAPSRAPAAPSAWERLENPVILDTALRAQPDGSVRRARLVRVTGKYPLVVFEGTLPAGDAGVADAAVLKPTARVADHVIVRAKDGVPEAEFRRAVAAAGLTVAGRLTPDGPWLVQLPGALQASGTVAYAEPDYLVHASDIPAAKVLVDVVGGVPTFPEAALDDAPAGRGGI